jgi:hypothetical protein
MLQESRRLGERPRERVSEARSRSFRCWADRLGQRYRTTASATWTFSVSPVTGSDEERYWIV